LSGVDVETLEAAAEAEAAAAAAVVGGIMRLFKEP
jgi:hypothetical protein